MRIAACFLISFFLIGCANKGKVPSGIIPKDEMSRILWDMVQADQYSEVYLVKDSTHKNVKMETLKLYQEVFQLHRVSLDDFRKSFHFYLDHPDMIRGLLDTALSRGNSQRSEIYKSPNAGPPGSKPVVTPPIFKPVNGRPSGTLPGAAPLSPHSIPPAGHGAVIPTRGAVIPNNHGLPGSSRPGKSAHVFHRKPGVIVTQQ
jgi:hypothetical protein